MSGSRGRFAAKETLKVKTTSSSNQDRRAADLVARASLRWLMAFPGEPVAVVLRRRRNRLAAGIARHDHPYPYVYRALSFRTAAVDAIYRI
jgi:hypothetical protein